MSRRGLISRRSFLKTAAVTAGIGAFTCVTQAGEVERLVVEHRKIKLENWDADGFKVGFLTDFHTHSKTQEDRAARAAMILFEQKPDVVLLGGDYINHGSDEWLGHLERSLDVFQNSSVPVLAVLGNHDYWSGAKGEIKKLLEKHCTAFLRNDAYVIDGVEILGYDDALTGAPRWDFAKQTRKRRSQIALLHEPDFVTRVEGSPSIMISGHSHGGQICLPFGISVHTPVGAKNYISGFYPDAKVPLYVSRGVGTTGPDIRAFCPPEVTILELFGAGKR